VNQQHRVYKNGTNGGITVYLKFTLPADFDPHEAGDIEFDSHIKTTQ